MDVVTSFDLAIHQHTASLSGCRRTLSASVSAHTGCPAVNTGRRPSGRGLPASALEKRPAADSPASRNGLQQRQARHGKAFAGRPPGRTASVPADNLRRPQSACVRLELHCVQPLHLPERYSAFFFWQSLQRAAFSSTCVPGLSAHQAEMTASRRVDGVLSLGVKAEFCLRPLLALCAISWLLCPTAQAENPPGISAGKTSPRSSGHETPSAPAEKAPGPSFWGGRLLQFFQQNDFRRTEAMSAVMHRLPGTAHILSGSTGPEQS